MKKQVTNNLASATIAATLITSFLVSMYFILEPRVTRSAAIDTSGPFTITQTITGETSFLVDANSVVMSGSINGLTGGQAFGTSTFAVQSNDPGGYFVDIAFADADLDGVAMHGINAGTGSIANYNLGATADYNFSTAQPNAVFAFTIDSVNPGDTFETFRNIGSTCGNPAGGDEAGQCWIGPSTTAPIRIVQRNAATASATTSLVFRVFVPSSASPVVPIDTYIATATLSLLLQ